MSHLTFTQALLKAKAMAHRTLIPGLHERLDAAVELVKEGHVFQTDTGEWQVASSSTAGLTYTVNGTCQCSDMHYNKPQWCKHQLAMFLSRRTMQLLAEPPAPVVPDLVEPYPDNDPEEVPVNPQTPAPPLPEAPSSANVRIQLHGYEVQVTLRDHDEAALLGRLEALLQRYPKPQPAPPASQCPSQSKDWCQVHQCAMKENVKDGRRWYSHLVDGQWCKGR